MGKFADLGEGQGCGDASKIVNIIWKWLQPEDEGNLPAKVAGNLGHPRGGSGLSTYP